MSVNPYDMEEWLICSACGQAIGVYEPMTVVAEGEAHDTPPPCRAQRRPAGTCYHRECFLRSSVGEGEPNDERPGTHMRTPAGADDGPIAVVDYDLIWPGCYQAERERLAPLLPGSVVHHIGSTAVPQLAAKPVIDMMALVADLGTSASAVMRGAGYRLPAHFNRNLSHRRYLCYPGIHYRTHHLHLVDAPGPLEQCLRFREVLRADTQLASEYAALKRALAKRFRSDREGYTNAKGDFIKDAERHASCTRSLNV